VCSVSRYSAIFRYRNYFDPADKGVAAHARCKCLLMWIFGENTDGIMTSNN
jgi:hypothetical protein